MEWNGVNVLAGSTIGSLTLGEGGLGCKSSIDLFRLLAGRFRERLRLSFHHIVDFGARYAMHDDSIIVPFEQELEICGAQHLEAL